MQKTNGWMEMSVKQLPAQQFDLLCRFLISRVARDAMKKETDKLEFVGVKYGECQTSDYR